MPKRPSLKSYKTPLIIGIISGIILAALVLLFGQSLLNAYYRTPSGRVRALNDLAKTICREHIYASEEEDPLGVAYQAYFESDTAPASGEIKKAFKEEIKQNQDAYYTLANLMLSHYDRYSNFSAPEIYEQMYPDNENYTGLGAAVSAYGPFIRIGSVYADSAAGRAGLQAGDLICSIGQTDIRALSYTDAQKLLAQALEEKTTLGVLRAGETEILSFDLQAEEVVIPNVSWEISDEIAYLKITLFRGDSFKDDINTALEAFKSAGAQYLILDMRDNRGGLISYLEFLLNRLVAEEGTLLFTEHYRQEDIQFFSEGGGAVFKDIVVLVNAQTCSSAEVVSGCLKDLGHTLIGQTTYGKAVGLSNWNFYGDKLVLATMTLELPETGDYNDLGIEPTIFIENELVQMESMACMPLNTDQEIRTDSPGDEILAMEQRLALLGYLFTGIDGVWDAQTDTALAQFHAANALEYTGNCSAQMLQTLDSLASSFLDGRYMEDTQLAYAYAFLDASMQPAA